MVTRHVEQEAKHPVVGCLVVTEDCHDDEERRWAHQKEGEECSGDGSSGPWTTRGSRRSPECLLGVVIAILAVVR